MAPLTLGVLPVVGVLLIFAMSVTTNDVKQPNELIDGSNEFSFDLYEQLKKPFENLIVSPISVQIVLALVYTGARGNTATDIDKVLRLPKGLEYVINEYKLLFEDLKDPGLNLTTKMFIEKTLPVKPEFQKNASIYFLSKAGFVNYVEDPESARKEINQWVEQTTNNRIKNFMAEVLVQSSTRMILTNAVYFKENWASQFNPALTKYDEFYITPDQKVFAKMMIQQNRFPYKHSLYLKAQILQLPYENTNFSMIIFLPDENIDLSNVEYTLGKSNFTEILRSLHYADLNVKLPKFTVNKRMELTETLKGLYINSLFNQCAADLTKIVEDLYATEALQKAYIEVNEEGTVAAVATALELSFHRLTERSTYIDFIANHPFLYIIAKDDTILFMGRVTNPRHS